MERQYGSLIRAMRQQMKQKPNAGTMYSGSAESGARYSMFVTLSQGLSTLVDAMAARLPAGTVRLNSPIERIERSDQAWWLWVEGSSDPLDFDGLIVATPAHRASKLLAPIDAELSAELGKIEYSGTAIVSLGYDVRQVGHPLDGMGAVVPSIENSPILACSFSSQKYCHRAPEGKTLLRVFVGGARRPDLAEMPDAELLPLVLGHLRPLLRIEGEPVFCDIAHWPRTMPQYHVGHQQRVARIDARLALLPGLKMASSAFRGVGLPDCIHGGEMAAEQILGIANEAVPK
jgi:oxygen-dependent protoporphyrinogen oxidase